LFARACGPASVSSPAALGQPSRQPAYTAAAHMASGDRGPAPGALRAAYYALRTSAAAAAAALGLSAALLSPRVRGGPPTVRFAVAGAGTEAFEAGAGAEARVRPGPSKPSLACLPQRLPMGGGEGWN
jgi:hypothetical protein